MKIIAVVIVFILVAIEAVLMVYYMAKDILFDIEVARYFRKKKKASGK